MTLTKNNVRHTNADPVADRMRRIAQHFQRVRLEGGHDPIVSKIPVRCVQTGERYESMTEAARVHGCTKQLIRQSIVHGVRGRGFNWERA